MPKVNISVTAVVPFVIAQKHKRQYRLAVLFSSRVPRSQRAEQVIQHRCQSKIAFITSWNEDNLMNVQQLLEFSLSLFLPFTLSLMRTHPFIFLSLSLSFTRTYFLSFHSPLHSCHSADVFTFHRAHLLFLLFHFLCYVLLSLSKWIGVLAIFFQNMLYTTYSSLFFPSNLTFSIYPG